MHGADLSQWSACRPDGSQRCRRISILKTTETLEMADHVTKWFWSVFRILMTPDSVSGWLFSQESRCTVFGKSLFKHSKSFRLTPPPPPPPPTEGYFGLNSHPLEIQPPPPRNFQWPSLTWIFSGTAHGIISSNQETAQALMGTLKIEDMSCCLATSGRNWWAQSRLGDGISPSTDTCSLNTWRRSLLVLMSSEQHFLVPMENGESMPV